MEILKHNLQFTTLSELNNLVSEIIKAFNAKGIKYNIDLNGEIDSVGDRLANRHFINFNAKGIDYTLDAIFDQSYFDEEEVDYLVIMIFKDNEYLENIKLENIL